MLLGPCPLAPISCGSSTATELRSRPIANLVYSANCSLDGYTADEQGNFDFTTPGEEVHAFWNDLERGIGTSLYGRRMYETMAVWDTAEMTEGKSAIVREYAEVWRDADKVVFSRTLDQVTTERTWLEREFDPDAIRRLKEDAERDISIGGPTLAAEAIRAGLVDEYQLVVAPVIVGGGTSVFPAGVRVDLELVDERRFTNGSVHLHYRTRS
jgi:dihydrofolate reductase